MPVPWTWSNAVSPVRTVCSRWPHGRQCDSRPSLRPMPIPRKTLQGERHEGVFKMTLARGTHRLESARLVLRRIAPDDLPFFTRIHALPEVAQNLYPGGRPRSPEETAAWLQYTLASYEQLTLGYLAVLRNEDGALIGRCGLMDLVVESAAPEHGIRRGWFGRAEGPAGVALTFET